MKRGRPTYMQVVLIGMKHCGKSTLGAALAARWGCPFFDVDPMMEAVYECDTGKRLTVRELWAAEGADIFRQLESQVVCDLYLRWNSRRQRPGCARP